MPYIGKSPTNGVRTRFLYTASANQTAFSGSDSASNVLTYSDGMYMDVYQNGVLLKPTTDYAATNGTSVTLTTGASASDVIEMVVYGVFTFKVITPRLNQIHVIHLKVTTVSYVSMVRQ